MGPFIMGLGRVACPCRIKLPREAHPSFDIWILTFDISIGLPEPPATRIRPASHAIALSEESLPAGDAGCFGPVLRIDIIQDIAIVISRYCWNF